MICFSSGRWRSQLSVLSFNSKQEFMVKFIIISLHCQWMVRLVQSCDWTRGLIGLYTWLSFSIHGSKSGNPYNFSFHHQWQLVHRPGAFTVPKVPALATIFKMTVTTILYLIGYVLITFTVFFCCCLTYIIRKQNTVQFIFVFVFFPRYGQCRSTPKFKF